MIVEQIWTANAYCNFNYLIVCPATGEAMAVDPLDANKSLSDAMLEVHQSLCVIRDEMASEKDAAAFNDIILALSGAAAGSLMRLRIS